MKSSKVAFTNITVTGKTAGTIINSNAYSWDGKRWSAPENQEELFSAPKIAGSQYIDPVSRSAVAASRILKIHIPDMESEKLGCIIGTKTSNAYSVFQYETTRLKGKRSSPILFAHAGWNIPVAMIASELGCRGFTSTMIYGKNSLEDIINYSDNVLHRKRCDIIINGIVNLMRFEVDEENQIISEASCILYISGLSEEGKISIDSGDFTKQDFLAGDIHKFAEILASR